MNAARTPRPFWQRAFHGNSNPTKAHGLPYQIQYSKAWNPTLVLEVSLNCIAPLIGSLISWELTPAVETGTGPPVSQQGETKGRVLLPSSRPYAKKGGSVHSPLHVLHRWATWMEEQRMGKDLNISPNPAKHQRICLILSMWAEPLAVHMLKVKHVLSALLDQGCNFWSFGRNKPHSGEMNHLQVRIG